MKISKKNRKKTPEFIKEIHAIRREIAKEYRKDRINFWKNAVERSKQLAEETAFQKKNLETAVA